MKVKANIFVERGILEKANEMALNVSKVCENALKQ
jgi:post-segregation antitoxin (ccd killing protein)